MGVFAQPCAVDTTQGFRGALFFKEHAATFETTLAAAITKTADVFCNLSIALSAFAGKIAMYRAHFHQRVKVDKAFADRAEVAARMFQLPGHKRQHRRPKRRR